MKKINHYLVLLLILSLSVTLPAITSADTNVSGIITADTTWTLPDSPYIVTGSVVVNSGVTLTIEPGVIIRFDSEVALRIAGTLIAIGTDTDNIIFTSNQATPTPGDWGYIFFTDSSTDAAYDADGNYTGGSILEYCVVEYAGSAILDNNGALRIDNAHPFINHCTIKDNTASGINAFNLTGTLKITNSILSDNTASSNGGGITVSGGTPIISGNTIVNNNAARSSSGGGIAAHSSTATISDNTVSSNTAGGGGGIGVYYSTVIISNNTISNNSAGEGSGIRTYSSTATISQNTISSNTAGNGGGISVYAGTVIISDNTICSNSATASPTRDNDGRAGGGGIIVQLSTATVSNNIIINNSASSGKGSGIYLIGSSSTTTISNNSISNNTAMNGGGIYGQGNMTNNIINNNTASLLGGGIYGKGNITNNTIIGNSAENASAVYYYSPLTDHDFTNNIITANISTDTAPTYTVFIDGNPLFNYNDIFNNTATYELWNNNDVDSADVNAGYNWWGTTDEAGVQAKIYDWFDDYAKGIVDYYPYLDSPYTSIIPNISASPTSHDFGSVDTGSSASRIFTISNTGTADLIITAVYLTGENPYQFKIQSENCSVAAIAPAGNCTVETSFSPTKTGALSAFIGMDSNDPDTQKLYIELSGTGVAVQEPVVPDIKANGSDGPITITTSDTLSITIELSPGSHDGENADWWILAKTASGWFHYSAATQSWQPGFAVSYQGPLREVPTREFLNRQIQTTDSYIFHFVVDTNMNGLVDKDVWYYDSVAVEVTN